MTTERATKLIMPTSSRVLAQPAQTTTQTVEDSTPPPSAGTLPYDEGRIVVDGDGYTFVDLTREQLPLLRALDPAAAERTAHVVTDWPGGRLPSAPVGRAVALAHSGVLAERVSALKAVRRADKFGVYRRGIGPLAIGGRNVNVGEEKEVSGTFGSGTVYFTGCSMRCVFCQYPDLAMERQGEALPPAALADIFLELQDRGVHNIQLMTPTHVMPEIVEALALAIDRGFSLPLVYNTGGFEDLDALQLLDGIVDVYVPDLKFGSNAAGKRLAGTPTYFDNACAAIREMHRQVGDIVVDDNGVARQGVLVRHLVMPGNVAEVEKIAAFLGSVSPQILVHVMDQYRPENGALRHPELAKSASAEDVANVKRLLWQHGVRRDLDRETFGI
jgi:putative pyruvate formate lyase activating enzyme